jgi:hypothetical protein
MGFSDFCFHVEANLFTSVAFSKGWRQFKKSYLPLALLEQPFFHNLGLCSFHSPFTSACWATWLPACIVDEGSGTKSDHGWLWWLWWQWCHHGFCIGVQCTAGIPDWLGQWQQRRGGLGELPDPSSLDVPLTLTLTLTGWNVFLPL